MNNVTRCILKAFKDKKCNPGDCIKRSKIKFELTYSEKKRFDQIVKSGSLGLYEFNSDLTSFTLTEAGFKVIYAYDARLTQGKIISVIRSKYEQPGKNIDRIHLLILMNELSEILNPAEKKDKCFKTTLDLLIGRGMIKLNGGFLYRTEIEIKIP